jgi:antibiotic biosynthesis monooxygenase (ABM) superfamily enzyme
MRTFDAVDRVAARRRAHLARDLSLVAIGITAMAPFTVGWDPMLRVFVLTLVTVALAVYVVVPWFFRVYDRYLAPHR